jgi:glycosyltransferase involved in cell wall biosynthesis
MRVYIVQQQIPHYRVELFNHLTSKYEVILLSLMKPNISNDNIKFKIINFSENRFIFNIKLIRLFIKEKNSVFIIGDHLRYLWLPFFRLFINLFSKNKRLLIWWGVTVFSKNYLFKKMKRILFYSRDFFIFYDHVTMNNFSSTYPNFSDKCVLSNNTIEVKSNNKISIESKDFIILNVGSLHKRKNNYDLIMDVKSLLNQGYTRIRLIFVGDGEEKNDLVTYVTKLKLQDKIIFYDQTTDAVQLSEIYNGANICASLGQAGLAILQSFGHGKAYITREHAISGGEINNIVHGYNGFLLNENLNFKTVIKILYEDRSLLRSINKNAKEYYNAFCTIDAYCDAFSKTIDECQGELLL